MLDAVRQFVGKHEVNGRVHIGVGAVVILIAGKRMANAVIKVQHRGHAVKAETVEVIFHHPVFDVGKQEVQHVGVAVIKHAAAPGLMEAFLPLAEKLRGRAVEFG